MPSLFVVVGVVGTVVGCGWWLLAKPIHKTPREHDLSKARTAVVVGATGATGEYLVYHLLSSPHWEKVTTIGRRTLSNTQLQKLGPIDMHTIASKLEQHIIGLEQMSETVEWMRGHDVVFCTLGTTRARAGSAKAFLAVDLDGVIETAKAARAARVEHFSLVTAQGSNSGLPLTEWGFLHPILYSATKGRAEDHVKGAGFPKATIFQPGMLFRPNSGRQLEVIAGKLLPSLHVSDLALAMVYDAESPPPDMLDKPVVYSDKAIRFTASEAKKKTHVA
eukprot:TRINITY_DN63332_c0_g1_i1.p1 TRINITY_DN63332_c0_g1~~TRINITY_DN63332_c0_g1_i1.p1  ORF type:complete len:277 (-),score=31.48 TRINITY_DN63332_c0_g1_i1:82-912(-)